MAIKNVLIVDDSPTDTHLLSEMLKKNGYAVSTAANAQEGIAKSKQEKPDLILMDIVMPGKRLRARPRASLPPRELPISRSSLSPPRVRKPTRPGACARARRKYMVKPITEQALLEN